MVGTSSPPLVAEPLAPQLARPLATSGTSGNGKFRTASTPSGKPNFNFSVLWHLWHFKMNGLRLPFNFSVSENLGADFGHFAARIDQTSLPLQQIQSALISSVRRFERAAPRWLEILRCASLLPSVAAKGSRSPDFSSWQIHWSSVMEGWPNDSSRISAKPLAAALTSAA